jgi:hypothetical protein
MTDQNFSSPPGSPPPYSFGNYGVQPPRPGVNPTPAPAPAVPPNAHVAASRPMPPVPRAMVESTSPESAAATAGSEPVAAKIKSTPLNSNTSDKNVPAPSKRSRREQKRRAREAWRSTGIGWRIFPRTLLGIVVTLLVFAVGAGISGAVLFAYYEARVTDSENKITEFSAGLDQRIAEGVEAVETASATANQRLAVVLGPYADLLQNEEGLPRVAGPAAPSTALVETKTLDGRPTVGTAVAVGEGGDGVILVASYKVVEAATADPGPEITLRRGNDRWTAKVLSWDKALGMAVLTSDADLPVAAFAPVNDLGVLVGSPVFAISALNQAVSPGVVVAVTADGFRHTGAVDTDFLGGPVVGQNGLIVGFALTNYAPDGIPGGSLPWSPTITQLCGSLLTCENTGATPRN